MTINKKARMPPVGDGAVAANNDNTPITEPPSNPVCIRLDEKRSLYNRGKYDDGLDWLRQPSNDLPAGAISKSVEIGIPNSNGSWDTISGDELYRNTQESIKERQMLDERFGVGNAPYSQPSGLTLRGKGASNHDDSSSSSSSLNL